MKLVDGNGRSKEDRLLCDCSSRNNVTLKMHSFRRSVFAFRFVSFRFESAFGEITRRRTRLFIGRENSLFATLLPKVLRKLRGEGRCSFIDRR